MSSNLRGLWFSLVCLLLLGAPNRGTAQIQYARGQDVTPAYDGWARNPDGTFSLYFGYLNRNFDEDLDIPIGPNNTIEPGGDRGQPTHFYARRKRFVFQVVVPRDWGLDRKVAWTLTVRGRTNVAKGWLQPEWEINEDIMAVGGRDPENKPPSITGTQTQTVTLPHTAALMVTAEDDGRPKPKGSQGGGVSISWIQYRGPGPVVFESEPESSIYGKPVTSRTTVSFAVPGAYWLRAIASDGSLEAIHDVNVTVK